MSNFLKLIVNYTKQLKTLYHFSFLQVNAPKNMKCMSFDLVTPTNENRTLGIILHCFLQWYLMKNNKLKPKKLILLGETDTEIATDAVGTSHFPFLLLFFIVNFVVDNILAHPPPSFLTQFSWIPHHHSQNYYYIHSICVNYLYKMEEKKNHYYYNNKEK